MTTRSKVLVAAVVVVVLGGCGEKMARIDVKEAPKKTEASAFTLSGAKVVFDKGGLWERVCDSHANPTSKGSGACGDLYFYVFPAVDAAWTPAMPVPAWVTCSGKEKSLKECETSLRAISGDVHGSVAVRVGDREKPMRTVSGWETAVDDATKRQGLTTPTGAPVVRLGKDD